MLFEFVFGGYYIKPLLILLLMSLHMSIDYLARLIDSRLNLKISTLLSRAGRAALLIPFYRIKKREKEEERGGGGDVGAVHLYALTKGGQGLEEFYL